MGISPASLFWYEQPKDKVHLSLCPYLAYLKRENQGHTQELLRNHRLYNNQPVTAFGPYAFYRNVSNVVQQFDSATLNVVSSCVDTFQARIAGTSRPSVEFATNNGDWLKQRKAKDRNRFLQGLFYQTKIYSLTPEVVRDAAIYGNGFLHGYNDNGRVAFERVFPIEMTIDPSEAMLGKPRQRFRTKNWTRDQVKRFAKSIGCGSSVLAAIDSADPVKGSQQQQVGMYSDAMIEVHEAWRLPSHKDAGDGYHAIVVGNATLLFEKYEKSFFPFVDYYYKRRALGFWGESIASMLVRNQVMLNRLLKIVDKSLVSFANPKIWAPAGSSFNPDTFTRDIGGVITSTIKPELLNSPIIPAEVYQWIENVYNKSFQTIGISPQSATAQKATGITSGTAINAVDDIQSDRLSIPSLAYEEMFVDIARLAISVMHDVIEDGDERDYEVKFPWRGGMQVMKWGDFDDEDFDEDDFIIQANAVNSLPKMIPGKLQYINDLQAMGVLAPHQIPRLIQNPDIDSVIEPMMAVQDRIYQKIDKILDDGEDGFDPPDQFLDPELSMTLFLQARAKAEYDGAPEDRIRMIDQYIVQLKDILAPPAPVPVANPAGPPAPMPAPAGAGGPSMAPVAPTAAPLALS